MFQLEIHSKGSPFKGENIEVTTEITDSQIHN